MFGGAALNPLAGRVFEVSDLQYIFTLHLLKRKF